MFTLRAFLLAFVSAATLTQALSLRNALAEVPSNASYVALDQVGGWLVSFTKEGKEISRHLVGKAANSTTHEKRVSVAGWPTLLAFAQNTWSSGSYTLQTNPSYAPTETAISCVAPSVQNVQLTGSPHCTLSTGNIGGTITGTTGSVTITFTSGYSSTSEWSVEIASQLSFSSTVEATIGIPELGDATVSDTMSVSISNTVGKSFSTSLDNEITQSVTVNAPQDSTCTLTARLSLQRRNVLSGGERSVEFIATGWAWFYYNTAVNGYHAYGLLIEDFISNESDRNSYMSFSAALMLYLPEAITLLASFETDVEVHASWFGSIGIWEFGLIIFSCIFGVSF
ncbi:hypothetical protein B0H13DRAFT_1879381 [Mycena leptocephala]|nr:hypothetical protein B0H13DRAFT_1879381 [Mycena leptocephala]